MLNVIFTLLALASNPHPVIDKPLPPIVVQGPAQQPIPAVQEPQFGLVVIPVGEEPHAQPIDPQEDSKVELDAAFKKAGWECDVTPPRSNGEQTQRHLRCVQTLGKKKSLVGTMIACSNTGSGKDYTVLNLGVGVDKKLLAGVALVLMCKGGGAGE